VRALVWGFKLLPPGARLEHGAEDYPSPNGERDQRARVSKLLSERQAAVFLADASYRVVKVHRATSKRGNVFSVHCRVFNLDTVTPRVGHCVLAHVK